MHVNKNRVASGAIIALAISLVGCQSITKKVNDWVQKGTNSILGNMTVFVGKVEGIKVSLDPTDPNLAKISLVYRRGTLRLPIKKMTKKIGKALSLTLETDSKDNNKRLISLGLNRDAIKNLEIKNREGLPNGVKVDVVKSKYLVSFTTKLEDESDVEEDIITWVYLGFVDGPDNTKKLRSIGVALNIPDMGPNGKLERTITRGLDRLAKEAEAEVEFGSFIERPSAEFPQEAPFTTSHELSLTKDGTKYSANAIATLGWFFGAKDGDTVKPSGIAAFIEIDDDFRKLANLQADGVSGQTTSEAKTTKLVTVEKFGERFTDVSRAKLRELANEAAKKKK